MMKCRLKEFSLLLILERKLNGGNANVGKAKFGNSSVRVVCVCVRGATEVRQTGTG